MANIIEYDPTNDFTLTAFRILLRCHPILSDLSGDISTACISYEIHSTELVVDVIHDGVVIRHWSTRDSSVILCYFDLFTHMPINNWNAHWLEEYFNKLLWG